MNFQQNFRQLSQLIWFMVLMVVLILFIGRLIFLTNIADVASLFSHREDVLTMLIVGGRFDLKIATIAFAPLLLVGLACAALPKLFSHIRRFIPSYAATIFFLVAGFSIGNYYYYLSYGNYIDVFIFGLFDDDTQAVLSNAWADFPIFRAFIASFIVMIVFSYATKKLLTRREILPRKKKWHWSVTLIMVLLMVVVYAVLARGSIGTLPLKRYHANVSGYDALNKVTPNAFMALNWALGDYKKQSTFKPVSQTELKKQMLKVLGQEVPEYTTPESSYLAVNKPHVVMVLMEGMGTNVMIEDEPHKNDLLGALRPSFENDFVFNRFLAGTSATINSLMMMLFHSNIPTISHSSVQNKVLPSSAILPYKRAGYESTFITAGNGMWRNLSNYLPLQGFDKFVDENTIKRTFPAASKYADTWGVPDEFAFKYADKLLKESVKPQMIYILTVTNHSPFRPPESYQPKPVKVSERMQSMLGSMSAQSEALLQTYQYANNCLGQFVEGIKQTDLVNNTIIAATGDHRVRYLHVDKKEEFGLTFGVPFYLYVPEPILANTEHYFDPQRIGSHRDIFPTLYHFSLSDTDYVSLGGENLLSPLPIANFGYNASRVITAEGAYGGPSTDKLYPWSTDGLHSLPTAIQNPYPNAANDYRLLQDMYLRSQVVN